MDVRARMRLLASLGSDNPSRDAAISLGHDMRAQFERQADFTDRYLASLPGHHNRTIITKEYVLNLHREVDEVLDEVPWKLHRATADPAPGQKERVTEEVVDIIKYCMGLAHVWGVTYDELVEAITHKSDLVEARWAREKA